MGIGMSLTNHVEIELGDGGEGASSDDREEGEVDRRREVLAEEEPGDEHAERRLTALDDVRERHGHLGHAHRRRDVTDRVRDGHLLDMSRVRTRRSRKNRADQEGFRRLPSLTGESAFQKSRSVCGASAILVAQDASMMAEPAARESVDVSHGYGNALSTFLL